jgi:hypothetical protein
MILFNNCAGRSHAAIYKDVRAFYDLGAEGYQADLVLNMALGDACLVARYEDWERRSEKLVFSRFLFERESIEPDDEGRNQRAFFGEYENKTPLTRQEALEIYPYDDFFNIQRFLCKVVTTDNLEKSDQSN